ncbi:MAG: transketolase [Rectinemataceae bacterium]
MEAEKLKRLEAAARQVRYDIVEAIGNIGIGHFGGALSIVEVLTVLYFSQMNASPANAKDPERDKLVLSKGHAGPALYAVLSQKGYFPREALFTLNQGGTSLPSHCDRNLTPGIDMTTGSLGQGLSVAIGMALADALDGRKNRIFAIIGDGESDEGQVWEAAMAASQYGLSRLIAFTDYNKMNIDGLTSEIMNLDDLGAKWRAFNWNVQRVDGHDLAAIDEAITLARLEVDRPSMIILDTIKGKGVSIAEGKLSSHNMAISREQKEEALAELAAAMGVRS